MPTSLFQDLKQYYEENELYCSICLERETIKHWTLSTCEGILLSREDMEYELIRRGKTMRHHYTTHTQSTKQEEASMTNLLLNIRFGKYHLQIRKVFPWISFTRNSYYDEYPYHKWFAVYQIGNYHHWESYD